jgi:hypothetical protein
MRKLILEIDISEEAFELLKSMKYKGSIEYRDSEFDNLEEFKNSTLFVEGLRKEDWFLERNAGGTLYLIHELSKYNLVENNFDSWHQTYHITELGKKFVEQNS